MGIFEEQLEQRRRADAQGLDDAIRELAAAATRQRGPVGSDSGQQLEGAIRQVLQFYHVKTREVPANVKTLEDRLEYLCRPCGVMRRSVQLEPGWYHDAVGAMLGFLQDDTPVALLPSRLGGYQYQDPATGKTVRLDRRTEGSLKPGAICFYRAFPQKKLTIPDLLVFALQCVSPTSVAAMLGMMGVTTLVGMLSPRVTYLLYNTVIPGGSMRLLAAAAVFMICVSISSLLFGTVNSMLSGIVNSQIEISVQSATMARIFSLPANFFRQFSAGEMSSRAGQINSLVSTLTSSFVFSSITSLFSLVYIGQVFVYAPSLVIPSVCMTLLTLLVTLLTTRMQTKLERRAMEEGSKTSGMVYAMLSGIQKIKLSGAENRAFARWARKHAKIVRLSYDRPLFLQLSGTVTMVISLLGNLVMYYCAVRSGVTVAEYYAFTASYGMVSGAFLSLAGIAMSAARIRPVLEMAKPILDAQPETDETRRPVGKLSGRIELSHVSFRYSDNMPMVLDDLSLRIRPGEYVALVGRTGCGKSTLIRLLLGFEKPQKGAVLFDGHDLNTIDLRSLRRSIGTVMQDGKLFQGSIFENIAISAPDLTEEEAWQAAELAGLADDIRDMPMGMHTMISEGSGGISGGQKQRLMIARAVAPKPKLLIFDEATSALDNITQKKVSESLNGLKCTRLVIAHRLSTIRQCDRILVLDGGKIIESGTYDELIARNGFFAELVSRQRLDADGE